MREDELIRRAKSFRSETPKELRTYIINEGQRPLFGPISGGVISTFSGIILSILSGVVAIHYQNHLKEKEFLRDQALKVAGDTIAILSSCKKSIKKLSDSVEKTDDEFTSAYREYDISMDECRDSLIRNYFYVRRYFDDDLASLLINPDDTNRNNVFNSSDVFEMFDAAGSLAIDRHNAMRNEKEDRKRNDEIMGGFESKHVEASRNLYYEKMSMIDKNTIIAMKAFDARLTSLGYPRVKFVSKP